MLGVSEEVELLEAFALVNGRCRFPGERLGCLRTSYFPVKNDCLMLSHSSPSQNYPYFFSSSSSAEFKMTPL